LLFKSANLCHRVIDTGTSLLKQHVFWATDPDFLLSHLNAIDELTEIGFTEGWRAITQPFPQCEPKLINLVRGNLIQWRIEAAFVDCRKTDQFLTPLLMP